MSIADAAEMTITIERRRRGTASYPHLMTTTDIPFHAKPCSVFDYLNCHVQLHQACFESLMPKID
jgi:hypothetical protein